jgi:hypothetical protein
MGVQEVQLVISKILMSRRLCNTATWQLCLLSIPAGSLGGRVGGKLQAGEKGEAGDEQRVSCGGAMTGCH